MFDGKNVVITGAASGIGLGLARAVALVNLLGVIAGSLAAYRRMVLQGHGHIVNTASLAGLAGSPLLNAYSTTKSAVVMFSRMLRAEGEALGVKVSALCPSFIQTGIFDAAQYAGAGKEEMVKQVPFPVMPLEPALRRIVAGVERNEALIVFPFHARLLYLLLRWFPALGRPLERKALEDFRRIRKPA